jgi:hypothetical protein
VNIPHNVWQIENYNCFMASLSLLKGLSQQTPINWMDFYLFILKQMDKIDCREEKSKQYGLEGVSPPPKHHAKAWELIQHIN